MVTSHKALALCCIIGFIEIILLTVLHHCKHALNTVICFYLPGKNNGAVNGIPYFKSRPRHGLFVRHDKLIMDKKRRGSRKSAANLMSRKSVTSPASKTHGSVKRK